MLKRRELLLTDYPILCSWIQSPEKLTLVCGEKGAKLTTNIIIRWVERAKDIVVIANESNSPVAFCTLSTEEWDALPKDYIELCHLMLSPEITNFFVGARLYQEALAYAAKNNYSHICGRMTRENRYALALAKYKKTSNFNYPGLPKEFIWKKLQTQQTLKSICTSETEGHEKIISN